MQPQELAHAVQPEPLPERPIPRRPEPNGLAFGLFLLVNVVLFLRPTDFIPGMLGVELYFYVILVCLFLALPALLSALMPKSLESRPIDVCILGLLPAIFLSHFVHADLDNAWTTSYAYAKILAYYLLFVGLVTSSRRLWWFIVVFVLCSAGVAILGMMDFSRTIRLPRLKNIHGMEAIEDPNRMYGPGIFQDPNDIALLLCVASLLLLALMSDKRLGLLRYLGTGLLALFAVGIFLTQSRGQLLSLAAGLGTLFILRFGWQRGMLMGLLIGPVLFAFMITRQADLSSHTDSGQTRVQLWNEGLVMFKANPLFGVGMNRYAEEAGQVAHNSYMHAFGELGFFGGLFFLAANLLALHGLYKLQERYLEPGGGWHRRRFADPEIERLYPFVAAAMVAYACGMFTLTLNSMVMTYSLLGMSALVIARAETTPSVPLTRFDINLMLRMAVASIGFLALMYVIVRALFRA